MKDIAASIIGIAFTGAIIYFFYIGKIPAELFCSLATGAIVWFFKDKEHQAIMRRLQK